MKKIIIGAAVFLLSMAEASAPDSTPIVRPCSDDECARFDSMFNKLGCDDRCRDKEIVKLASSFDIKRDLEYLRTLVCANKRDGRYIERSFIGGVTDGATIKGKFNLKAHYRMWKWKGQLIYRVENLKIIDTAVQNNNYSFLKAFFDLFPSQSYKSYLSYLSTDALPVVKSEKMTELFIKENVHLANKSEACLEEHRTHSKDRPGCPVLAAHIQKVTTEYEERLKRESSIRTNDLRDIVSAAKK